jgi:superoxide dismutase, Cu-Zn family
MPNQFVGADGKLRAHVINPDVTLGSGEGTLFDADGSAVLIHTKADDYRSQPSGEAGDRLACAVVTK